AGRVGVRSWTLMELAGLAGDVLLLAVLCTGLGLALASPAVYLRVVRFFVDVGVLLVFLSAVFFSASSVPSSIAWMVDFNPLAAAFLPTGMHSWAGSSPERRSGSRWASRLWRPIAWHRGL